MWKRKAKDQNHQDTCKEYEKRYTLATVKSSCKVREVKMA